MAVIALQASRTHNDRTCSQIYAAVNPTREDGFGTGCRAYGGDVMTYAGCYRFTSTDTLFRNTGNDHLGGQSGTATLPGSSTPGARK